MKKEKIVVLGGGSWGATLATHLAQNKHEVTLWEYFPEVVESLKKTRTLKTLPQLRLPESVKVTSHIKEAAEGKNIVLSAVPSHTVRSTFKAARDAAFKKGALIISATKGIETTTFKRMSEIIEELVPDAKGVVVLAGPSHAEEVAMEQPVVMVAASQKKEYAEEVRDLFASDLFRIYASVDPAGVELGGALKNIYALACGVVDGLSYGDNIKAALMSRGLIEMTRLGTALGAKTATFFGLTGLGDLIVTCNSKHSRNRLLGEKIGSGKNLKQALSEMTMVAEGVNSTQSAYHLAKQKGIEAPIINEMYQVLFEDKPPRESIKDLMSRQVGTEMEGVVL